MVTVFVLAARIVGLRLADTGAGRNEMRASASLAHGSNVAEGRVKSWRDYAVLDAAPWGLLAVVSSQALFLGALSASGKIPPVVFRVFRALLTF